MNPLDSIVVKRIEEKEKVKKKSIIRQKTVSICCKGKGQFVPMKVEIQETSSKNSLLDRLTSLETRLFQLCLEIEAAKTSCSSNIQTPFTERSRNDIKKQTDWNSYPTFDYPKPPSKSQSQLCLNECESSQNKSHRMAQNLEQPSSMKEELHFGRSKSTKDGKNTSKNGKKNLKASWPHLRILGC